MDGVVRLLADGVLFTMPPIALEWQGVDKAEQFLKVMTVKAGHGRHLVGTRANGQPAYALYVRDRHGALLHAVGLLVLTLSGNRISAITRFDTAALAHFGIPRTFGLDRTP